MANCSNCSFTPLQRITQKYLQDAVDDEMIAKKANANPEPIKGFVLLTDKNGTYGKTFLLDKDTDFSEVYPVRDPVREPVLEPVRSTTLNAVAAFLTGLLSGGK